MSTVGDISILEVKNLLFVCSKSCRKTLIIIKYLDSNQRVILHCLRPPLLHHILKRSTLIDEH